MNEQEDYMKFLPAGLVAIVLGVAAILLLRRPRKPRSFRDDPVGALKDRGEIVAGKAERIPRRPFDVISARAFAPLGRLFQLGTGLSTAKSVWLLPKGRNAQTELEALDPSWQGEFRLEPSVTDPEARIIVAEGVRRAGRRKSR